MEQQHGFWWSRHVCVCFLLFLSQSSRADDDPILSNIQRLRDKLFKNYNNRTRPVISHTNTTTVYVDLVPVMLIDLDENNQRMVLDIYMVLEWRDEHLTWDPKEYDGLTSIPVASYEIWRPDITIYNSSPVANLYPLGNTPAVLNSSGWVNWDPSAIVHSLCPMNQTQYPKDEHECGISMGSWTQDGWAVDLRLKHDEIHYESLYYTHSEWKVYNGKGERNEYYYACCPEPYLYLKYTFTFRRVPPTSLRVAWVPTVIAIVLTLGMFLIAPDSGKKIFLGCTALLLLSWTVIYLALAAKSPLVPIYGGTCIKSLMVLVTCALILEVLVLNVSRIRVESPPPEVLVILATGVCGALLCVCPLRLKQKNEKSEEPTLVTPVQKEWYLVATALDRILMHLFLLIMVITVTTA